MKDLCRDERQLRIVDLEGALILFAQMRAGDRYFTCPGSFAFADMGALRWNVAQKLGAKKCGQLSADVSILYLRLNCMASLYGFLAGPTDGKSITYNEHC